VIAILHDLGASKKLSAIISGESVLNDGSAIVVVTLFLQLQAAVPMSPGDIVALCSASVWARSRWGLGSG
jgi:NhaP-type Na+/H+ or K+/H+ antiporter